MSDQAIQRGHWAEKSVAQRQTKQQTRQRRINRFIRSQLRKREWVNLNELATACSETGSIVSDAAKLESAYAKLLGDLVAGFFEDDKGRSKTLYLDLGWCGRLRHTAIRMLEKSDYGVLRHCWVSRQFAEKWFAWHQLGPLPARFAPPTNAIEIAARFITEGVTEENNDVLNGAPLPDRRHEATAEDSAAFLEDAKQHFRDHGVGPCCKTAEKWARDRRIISSRDWARLEIKKLPPRLRRKRGNGLALE